MKLLCVSNGVLVGELEKRQSELSFRYSRFWISNENAHPISLRMPVSDIEWSGTGLKNYMWGLLPDDPTLLKQWGNRYGASHKDPFQLLLHRGEDCAGDIQFLTEDAFAVVTDTEKTSAPAHIPIQELYSALDELIDSLGTPRQGRGEENTGRFSLPGAQPKMALHYGEPEPWWKPHPDAPKFKKGRKYWFQSTSRYPTTHILKPQRPEYEDFAINEHFCLELARAIGIPSARSFVITGGKYKTIAVERYDRKKVGDKWLRYHQEDICQSLGVHPEKKYQSDGDPSARDIVKLLEDVSSEPELDIRRFIDALIFNWIIGGSDAHAKNYSLLIGSHKSCRLARIYDVASALPYPVQHPIQKLRLAMKIGSEYRISRIDRHQWEKFLTTIPSRYQVGTETVISMIRDVKTSTKQVGETVKGDLGASPFIDRLIDAIEKRTALLEEKFS